MDENKSMKDENNINDEKQKKRMNWSKVYQIRILMMVIALLVLLPLAIIFIYIFFQTKDISMLIYGLFSSMLFIFFIFVIFFRKMILRGLPS